MKRRSAHTENFPQGILAVAAVLAVTLTLYLTHSKSAPTDTAPATIIAIEHKNTLILSVTMSTGKEQGLIEFSQSGDERALLSLPSEWTLREVRGRPLSDVSSEKPNLGYTRWQLPSEATASFSFLHEPALLKLSNPMHVPLEVRVKRVNLLTGAVEENIVLIKETDTNLW